MGNRGRSILKRQKERTRDDRKKLKLERRAQRNSDRKERPNTGEDPDLAGMVAGPQPPRADE